MNKKFLLLVYFILLNTVQLVALSFSYSIKDLDTLTSKWSVAKGINDKGAVVGNCQEAPTYLPLNGRYDFVWDPTLGLHKFVPTMDSLGIYSYAQIIPGNKINTHSQVLIQFAAQMSEMDFWNPVTGFKEVASLDPYLKWWSDRSSVFLPIDFNDANHILGTLISEENKFNVSPMSRRFGVWDPKSRQVIELTTPILNLLEKNGITVKSVTPLKINRTGNLLLTLVKSKENIRKTASYIWDKKLHEVPLEKAIHFNNLNQVLIQNEQTAYLWDPPSGIIRLGDFTAQGFNDQGEIVGYQTHEGKQRGCYWCQRKLYLLDDLIDFSAYPASNGEIWETITAVYSINNWGQIVGEGIISGQRQALLLTPLLTDLEKKEYEN